MLITRRTALFGRLWRKPAVMGFAISVAVMVALGMPPAASAAQFQLVGIQSSGPTVPAAGHLSATLLGPQPKHQPVAAPSGPAHTKDPAAARAAKAKADAESLRASGAPQTSTVKPAGSLFGGLNAPGLTAQDEGAAATPPDATGAIGPTRYVEMVNQLVGVYDRANLTQLSKLDFAGFAHVPGGLATSDPQIQWDPIANRWLYGMVGIATGANYLLFGWTKTADPSDLANGWCTYGAPTGSYLQDYPKLGHDANWVTFGTNIYDDSKPGFPFVTAQIWAFPKPAAADTTCSSPVNATYFADAAHLLKNSDGTLAFTPIPANTTDAVNDYIVSARDVSAGTASKVMVWHMEARPAATLVPDGDISVGAYTTPPSVPQPGTTYLLDSLDGRLTQAVARFDPTAGAEGLWTQQTVAGSGRSVVRWYEFLPTRKTIYQQGTLQSSTDYYFNAAISPSWAGNEASISYNRASSTLLSMIGAQTRSSSTPLGQMDAGELPLGSSSAANQEAAFQTNCNPNPCRWGDYSGASPDPVNAHVVWGSNQIDGPVFLGYAQWTTQNFAVSTVPPAPDFTLSVSPASQSVVVGASTSYTVNVARVGGFGGGVTLTLSGLPTGASGSFSPNPASGATSRLSVTTGSTTPVGTSTFTVTGKSGSLTRTAAGTLVVNPPPSPDFSLSASPSSQTITQGAGTSYTITVTRTLGFSGAVSLSASGLPAGSTSTFSPNPASGTSSTFSVTSSAGTPQGTYALTITGTSGSLTRTAMATLVVSPPPPCASASLTPASTTQTVGSTINFTATSSGCTNPQYEYWVQLPDTTWTMQRAFSTDPRWSWNTTGRASGVYTVHVWANQIGDSMDRGEAIGSSTVTLTSASCTSASIAPSSSTQPLGATVQFTASSTGCPSPQYEYWAQFPDGSWNLQRAFSTDPTWNWNTAGIGLAPGVYTVHVWANQTGDSTALAEAIGSSTVTLNGCTSAGITPSSTTRPAGSTINFTATSGGCANPKYEYWVQLLDGSWTMQRAFSTDPTWSWSTGGLAPGVYTVHVWANQTGDSAALGEAIASSTVTLTGTAPAPCASASISPASTSQPAGSTILLTASSTGCPNPQYEYWVQFLDGTWSIQRTFSTDPTWSWNTAGLAPGVYTVHVWANQVGDPTNTFEGNGSSTVTLTGGCTSAGLSPASTTQPVGTVINFTATSGGCANPKYQYWVQLLDGSWTMQRAFSTDPTWSWSTASLAPGTYTVHVWANQTGDSAALGEAIASSMVTLTGTAPAPCASASLSPASASQPAGSTIAFMASSTGCPSPQYEYWVQFLDGTWRMLRGFSTDPTWSWSTSGLAPGVYSVHVWANQIGDPTGTFEGNGASTITLTGCTSAALTPSSGSAAGGTAVTFTASSTGCPTPLYQFWLQDTSGGWRIVQTFSTSNTWQWNTGGWPTGIYNIHVWANQQGADLSTWEGNGAATFTVS